MKLNNIVNIVYKEDYFLFMKRFVDNYFHIAYLDPPYGIKESSKNRKSRNTPVKQKNGTISKIQYNTIPSEKWDDEIPNFLFFKEVFRISQVYFIWGANYYPEIINPFKPPKRNEYNKFISENPYGWIIWDKVNGNNDFNDCEMAYCSLGLPSVIVTYMWNGMFQGVSVKNGHIQKGNKKENEKRIHLTQKPMAINYWVFNDYLKPYLDTLNQNQQQIKVCDTGVGSGGSRITAYDMKFHFYGCEISEYSFNAQEKRFNNHVNQLAFIF